MSDDTEQPTPPDYVRLLSGQQCEEALLDYILKHEIVPVGSFKVSMSWEIHREMELVVRLELFEEGTRPS